MLHISIHVHLQIEFTFHNLLLHTKTFCIVDVVVIKPPQVHAIGINRTFKPLIIDRSFALTKANSMQIVILAFW